MGRSCSIFCWHWQLPFTELLHCGFFFIKLRMACVGRINQLLLMSKSVSARLTSQPPIRQIHQTIILMSDKMGKTDPRLVLSSTKNNVTTLTMNDPYYCAGVNLSAAIQPMHP